MLIFGTQPTFLDEMTSGEEFSKHLPHISNQLDAIHDIQPLDEITQIKAGFMPNAKQGSMGKLIANIPWEIWAMLCQIDPDIDHDKKRFYSWLDKHPEYKATR